MSGRNSLPLLNETLVTGVDSRCSLAVSFGPSVLMACRRYAHMMARIYPTTTAVVAGHSEEDTPDLTSLSFRDDQANIGMESCSLPEVLFVMPEAEHYFINLRRLPNARNG